MTDTCILCGYASNVVPRNYGNPTPVCLDCYAMMMRSTEEQIQAAYNICLRKGWVRMAGGIKPYLEHIGVKNVKRPRRGTNRKGSHGISRPKKKPNRPVKANRRASILQGQ